jgi:hypothetical protein
MISLDDDEWIRVDSEFGGAVRRVTVTAGWLHTPPVLIDC